MALLGNLDKNSDVQDSSKKDASNGYAGLTLFKINLRNAANTFTSFLSNANTAARNYLLPDRDGTLADDTDIANAKNRANHTGTQTASTISNFNAAALLAAPAETQATVGGLMTTAAAKTTPVDADLFALADSAASGIVRKLSWASLKTAVKGVTDAAYRYPLYYPVSVKAGDTLTNPIAETAFASKMTIAANSLLLGQKIYWHIQGTYMIPGGTLAPTATARIKLGSTVLISSGALSVGLGSGVEYGFTADGDFTILSVGASGTCLSKGNLVFQLTNGGAPTSAEIIVNTGVVSINTTVAQDLAATVISTPNVPTAFFKILDFDISTNQKPTAAN